MRAPGRKREKNSFSPRVVLYPTTQAMPNCCEFHTCSAHEGAIPNMKSSPRQRVPNTAQPNRCVGLGIIGLGTVGTGTLKVLADHQREIQRRQGCDLQLKVVCSRSVQKRDLSWLGQRVKITTDWKEVVADPEVNIVVELVGV